MSNERSSTPRPIWKFITPENLLRLNNIASSTLRKYGRDSIQVTDLAQEAILRVLEADQKKHLKFNSNDHFLRWMRRTLQYVVIESNRASRKWKNLGPADESIPDASAIRVEPDEYLLKEISNRFPPEGLELWNDLLRSGASSSDLENALSRLNALDNEIVHLRLKGFPYRKIASRLEISSDAARQRFSRAKDELRRRLQR